MTDQHPNLITPQDLEGVTITAATVQPSTISIPLNGRPIVTIRPDGQLEFGEDYTPDAAAQAFWEAVQRLTPSPAEQQFGPHLKATINKHLKEGEEAERKVKRLDQMAQAWSERLPDTIRRDTVVEAIHQVTRGDAG